MLMCVCCQMLLIFNGVNKNITVKIPTYAVGYIDVGV